MYGLIHTALQQMIVENYGAERWSEVLKIASVSDESFFSTRSYDDEVTFALVQSVSEVLSAPIDDCLELFGQFWLKEFAPQSYDMLLQAAGSSLFDFLDNLNALHDRISTTFVGYVPPSFHLQRVSDSEATLEYRSSRNGMVPFVIGLIKGMQDRFDVQITIHAVNVVNKNPGVQALIKLEVVPR
jgi:guanylate cyclase soluble subunit beta